MNTALSNPTPSSTAEGNTNTAQQNLQQNPIRWIPKGSEERTREGVGAVVYITGEREALGYIGRAGKPAWRYRFVSRERRDIYIERFFDNVQARRDRRKERRAVRSEFRTTLSVGDILCGTWGYDQTNADFFQVVEVLPSRQSIRLRPIQADIVERGGSMSGDAMPLRDEFKGGPMLKRVLPGDRCKVEYCTLGKWDGDPVHCSWYA